MRVSVFVLLAILHGVGGLLISTSSAEPVRSVAEARGLPVAAVAEGREVALSGVVTYVRSIDSDFNFSIHDGTGGVMVYSDERKSIAPGQRVSLTGVTAASVHGLRVVKAVLTVGEAGPLPEPVRTTMAEVREGRYEGEYAEMEGILRAVRLEAPEVKPQRLALDFGGRSRRLTVWLPDYPAGPGQFHPGAAMRVRGVVMRWRNPRGQTQNINVLANSERDVVEVTSAPPPEPETIDAAQLWDGPDEPGRRVQFAGTVTWIAPDHAALVLQAGSHAMRVRLAEGLTCRAKPTEWASVSGFPGLGEYTVELEDAQVDQIGSGESLPPEPLSSGPAVLAGPGLVDRDARLISLPATLVNLKERDDDRRVLELTSDGVSFPALLPSEAILPGTVRPGSLLRLTGICDLHLSEERRRIARQPGAFRLLLRDGGDVEVLRPGPWWTASRLRIATLLATGGLLLLGAWTDTLRRANQRLRQEVAAREQAERELSNERRRMAAELHDTLEQTLTAAALQLNAASRLGSQKPPPDAPDPLTLARQLITRSRQEVREAVWDLRLDQSPAMPLGSLLRQVCEESSAGPASIDLILEGGDPPCPAHLAVQVIRLVREAIANALKHGNPQQVRVTLESTSAEIRVTISDDGCGFVTASVPGPDRGHFGLSGMEERAQRAGGRVEIESSPGKGCRVRIWIPLATT
jgi:signal transduction histidine kinase